MSQIDQSVLEAARMDGAGNLRTLASIIWPGVRGTTLALGILSAIGALKTFDVPYLVTVGGPNYATEFLGTYIYRKTIPQSTSATAPRCRSSCWCSRWSSRSSCRSAAARREGELMFEVRSRGGRLLLQLVVTLLVLPFLFPLVAMVQGLARRRRLGQLRGRARRARPRALLRQHRRHRGRRDRASSTRSPCWPRTGSPSCTSGAGRSTSGCCWPASRCPRSCCSRRCSPRRQAFGFFDTYWAVILPLAALQVPFAVLLTRNFVNGIPDELFEAARVDGASSLRGFIHLVIPLTRPIAAAILIFTLIGAWNDYLMPLVFLQSHRDADDHAGAAVLRRRVQQRPDQDPGLGGADRDPRDRRLPVPAAPVRARPRGRRHQVSHPSVRPSRRS